MARHRADLTLRFADAERASLVLAAVREELAAGPDGTRADAAQDGPALLLQLEADDAAGLRALLQGVLRLMDAADRIAAA